MGEALRKNVVTIPEGRLPNLKPLKGGKATVGEVYDAFLSMHAKNSEDTLRNYKYRVDEYFRLTLGKPVRECSVKEIQSISKSHVQTDYIDKLVEKGNKFNTISVKMNSVRSFYNELLSNGIEVNNMIFKVKLPDDREHHEALSFDELQQLFEFMKSEKELSMEKYLLVKMMFTTAIRKTATMGVKAECGMTWEDNFVIRKDVNTGENIVVVRVKDKGNKWHERPISDEFYEELQQINYGQKYVFPFNPRTLQRSLERFSRQLGRNITPHSLKATAITLGYEMTKNIELCRQLGGHSSIVTTQAYLREDKSLINQLSYNMSREIDESLIDRISHEELISIIKSNKDIKMAILMRLGSV